MIAVNFFWSVSTLYQIIHYNQLINDYFCHIKTFKDFIITDSLHLSPTDLEYKVLKITQPTTDTETQT